MKMLMGAAILFYDVVVDDASFRFAGQITDYCLMRAQIVEIALMFFTVGLKYKVVTG